MNSVERARDSLLKHMLVYENAADSGDNSPEAKAAAELSEAVGRYLALVHHPGVPDWAVRQIQQGIDV